jgi:iron-sulfur cluster repair protein YtfE (RIC family)
MTTQRRHDPYGAVHKGIRAAHMRCLVAIGAADATSDALVDRLVAEIREHLAMCGTHLEDENAVLHVALDARRPGASAHAAEDHDDHLHSFAELQTLLSQLVSAAPEDRTAVLAALYRRFGRFVADDLLHMDHEEHVLLPELQAAFSDAELRELEGRIVATIAPEHMVLFLDAMLEAMPESDGTAMLDAMRTGMPPGAYAALMQAVDDRRRGRASMSQAA